ncbi:MAG: lysophospholipid acyltransferase family protein [Acidobacteriaceae bacterium]|nr:lysophospholipid acyltransferase family protein [Acidobacteriaceae bacterium]
MQTRRLPIDVSAASLLPPAVANLVRPLEPALLKILFPDKLLRSVPEPESGADTAARFAEQLLQNLNIRYQISDADLQRIPANGSALIVANHPFGFLEGLLLLTLLERVRADYRIVANGLLSSVEALRSRLIFVNPFQENASAQENGRGLRASLEWLQAGGMLVMFPAGEVAHLNWRERAVADPKWNTAPVRLARRAGCVTLPLFFEGTNSLRFQMIGTIHPRLRTLNLARELINKSKQTIQVRIGSAIAPGVLRGYADVEAATEYLRARTYLLLNRTAEGGTPEFGGKTRARLIPPVASRLMAAEAASLPPERTLAATSDFTVYVASAHEIPNVLREIGRCREMTYREIGEGTGNSFDLDEFDDYYQHIFLWAPKDGRVAGAYRVAATPNVLESRGIKGLYTSTLFHYDPAFFARIGPALELGRSFICRDYQKHYAPLLLLWKGIAEWVRMRPECAVLFGAVSISSEYQSLSQTLIVNFLNGHLTNEMSDLVRARRGYRRPAMLPKHLKQLSRLLPTIEELSSSIQDLEGDGKGVPVLIRQYLKLGGQFLGFNVDPHFSNALDALILADLRTATKPMLERCMGREGAAQFRAFHRIPES